MTEPVGDTEVEAHRSGDHGPTTVQVDVASIARIVVVALVALTIYAVLRLAPSMVTRVMVGVVLALALDPVVVRVHRRFDWQRGTAVALVGTLLGFAFLGVLLVLGPAAIDQVGSLRDDLPNTVEQAYDWPVVGERLERNDAADRVDQAIEDLPAQLDDATLTRYAEDLLGGLLTTVVVLVTAVAVMLDGARIVERLRGVVPPDRRLTVDSVGRVVYRTFGNYFAGSLFVAILNGLVVLTVALALGVPLAPLAGLWSALTNLIPQIGGFLGGSFLVLLALTEGPLVALIAGAIFLVYQNIENNVIQPAVVGKAVDLTPPSTMLAALIGGAVAGVPGALVATPIVGAVKILYLRDREDGRLDGDGLDDDEGLGGVGRVDTRPD